MKTLAKEHSILAFTRDPGNGNYDLTESASPMWTQPYPNSGVFVSSTYFDLAGMSMEEKTLFFRGATVQDVLNPSTTGSAPGDSMGVVDLMSTRPLSNDEIFFFLVNGNLSGPGSSTLTFSETVYGRIRQFVTTVDTGAWGSMSLLSTNQLGSMQPTASDRIYSYKLISVAGALVAGQVYGSRHLLAAEAIEEKDHEYMMRLMRSYELQQTHDED